MIKLDHIARGASRIEAGDRALAEAGRILEGFRIQPSGGDRLRRVGVEVERVRAGRQLSFAEDDEIVRPLAERSRFPEPLVMSWASATSAPAVLYTSSYDEYARPVTPA